MNKQFDMVMIGGGISGCVAAILLQKAGYSTAIIDRSDLRKFKAGESLTPKCRRWLDSLRISFDQSEAVEYFGVHSKWGRDETEESSFIFNPYGNGLAIIRSDFELKLIDEAILSGVAVSLSTQIKFVHFDKDLWEVRTESEKGLTLIHGKLLIVATGKNSFQAIDKCKHIYFDHQFALSSVYSQSSSTVQEPYLFIEALHNGWFYSNLLPERKMIVSLITDGDLIPTSKLLKSYFLQQIHQTEWTRHIELQSQSEHPLFVSDARTRWTENQSGKNWIRIGDAAFTIDPLSGQGIEKNLEMIFFCIEHIKLFLKNTGNIRDRYFDFNRQRFSGYLKQQSSVYQAEQRWRENIYWKRRINMQMSD